ncbi:copper homeostasis periplasmic binding protein CopC [Duganella sp. FT92W]|uniref:Copper homeostasis periplasmic binding protein CopC n=1 Tax=Pseudoduganella rivuli TaxID=2666085 RepID=A0A7X2IPA1_9BURK|nr:copper homeostasis periplasmic binding protein CopC [Pseudoduganella rivuli]MRV73509.1 copper homeostasis periplasmic binding protein CopC [Pseudoduganella rivuli]
MKALHTLAAAAALAGAVLVAPLASAHAVLKSSAPQAGAVLAAAPRDITLTFNEKIEEAFSSITVTRGDGGAVTTGKAKPDSANPAVMHVEVPALTAGDYSVKWAVAGHDGHRRTGEFKFTVK